jgi:hypothetical protein
VVAAEIGRLIGIVRTTKGHGDAGGRAPSPPLAAPVDDPAVGEHSKEVL